MKSSTIDSPIEGTVCNIKVAEHDHLQAGQTLLGIRDKQMLHLITADAEAAVDRLLVSEGSFVEPGEPLMAVHEERPAQSAAKPQADDDVADPEDSSTWKLV